MRWRSTPRFVCQSWTIILASVLCCGIGLAQVGLGAWVWILSENFILVIGEPARNVCVGYLIIGIAVFLMCSLGVIAAFLRRRIGMLLYAVFSVASVAGQVGVWIFIYLEYERSSQMIADRIRERRQYDDFLTAEFNCNLQAGTQFEQGLEACANFVSQWMWRVVGGMLGLSAVLIVVQFILMLLASMLFVLISEEQIRSKVRISPDLDNESISSTNQLVATPLPLETTRSNKTLQAISSTALSPFSQSRESVSSDTISLISLRENNNNNNSIAVNNSGQNTTVPKNIAPASPSSISRRQSIEIKLSTNVATNINVTANEPKNSSVASNPSIAKSRATPFTQPGRKSPQLSDISSSSTRSIASSSSTKDGITKIKSTIAKSTPSPIPIKSKTIPKASGNSSPVPITHVSEALTETSPSASTPSSNPNQKKSVASTFKKWFGKRSPKASPTVAQVKPTSQATAQSPDSTLHTPYESYDTAAAKTATTDSLQPLPSRPRPKKKPKIVKKFSTIEV